MEEQIINEEKKEETITEPQIDWHEKYLYLAADTENMRKQFNKRLNNAIEYGKEDIFLDIIIYMLNIEKMIFGNLQHIIQLKPIK